MSIIIVGDNGDPIITPVLAPLLMSNMRVLGVSSGGSHAAAHATGGKRFWLETLVSVDAVLDLDQAWDGDV